MCCLGLFSCRSECQNTDSRGPANINPKLYARITRFFNAVENKMMNPAKKWTDIVYEGGFFDQAHFIKEVKTFSSKTPEEFFTLSPPPKEDVTEEVRV